MLRDLLAASRFLVMTVLMMAWTMAFSPTARGQDAVSYQRDVRPILAANCFACHGPDEHARQAQLRLDTRAGATADLGGYQAVKPGDPESSALIERVASSDPDERMPPPDSGKSLTASAVDTLRRWIVAGAPYRRHWAFTPVRRPPLPAIAKLAQTSLATRPSSGTNISESRVAELAHWPSNPIDNFVLARLLAHGQHPSPQADRYTLVRRVYLDLIGLPPTPEEADRFVHDDDPRAWKTLVDRLLASPHYGERWARQWLDLARYADTNGYEKDRPRSIWPYRDWVIRALNNDMPFDQFTIEQLAGDMLPGATLDQQIATGMHRNTMLNEEGGIDPLEFRFHAMVDRVATTATVWMGLTLGCAQCHSHKYDPISHTDYYRFMALLNNADEPELTVPAAEIVARRRVIEQQIATLQQQLPRHFPPGEGDGPIDARRKRHFRRRLAEWIKAEYGRAVAWTVVIPHRMRSNLPKLEVLADGSIFSSGDITKRDVFTLEFQLDESERPVTALRLEVLPDERLPAHGPGRAYYEGPKGDFFLSEVTARVGSRPVRFASASHSYGKITIGSGNANAENVIDGDGSTGWSTAGREGQSHQLVLNLEPPLAASGELTLQLLFERHYAASLGRFRVSVTSDTSSPRARDMPVPIQQLLARDPDSWNDGDRQQVTAYYLSVAPELADARRPIEQLLDQLPPLPTTLVMHERPPDNPRTTHRHHRGEYLSRREAVTPGVPAIFPPLPKTAPADRLALARWLVSRRNPLVGRVTVNRAWRAFFGHGLVRANGDFGTQSEPPTHPELLDWLASELVEQGWSMKRLHRLIVTSATYRQGSRVTPDSWRRDPQNRLLARGPRLRLSAEMVRDIGLKASGLLSPKVGGPSVYPPQPASVTALAYGGTKWNVSTGEDRYRRSLYTFTKRTAPFAAYAVFDAPSGETCVARRDRSNTPLQALTLLNDAMFLEMTQALARNALADSARADQQVVTVIFRRLLTRPPGPDELAALLAFQEAQHRRLQVGELDAAKIAGDPRADARLASWVLVARAVMNLDETITKN